MNAGADEETTVGRGVAVKFRWPTSTVWSWLRFSTATNQKALFGTIGPPMDPPYCSRSNGGFGTFGPRIRAGRACSSLWRKKKNAEPCSSLAPDLVTMFTMLELERPTSAVNLLVAIWNSLTPSWGKFISVPPTTSSLLSAPSTVRLPPRPKAPAEETSNVFVLVGS